MGHPLNSDLATAHLLKTCWRNTGGGPPRRGYLVLVKPPIPETMAAAVEAYCVKCKAKRDMKDPKENIMANGRKAMKGTCPTCGTGMFKIMGKA